MHAHICIPRNNIDCRNAIQSRTTPISHEEIPCWNIFNCPGKSREVLTPTVVFLNPTDFFENSESEKHISSRWW